MKRHKQCQTCGHMETAYTINLSEKMVDGFIIFMKKFEQEKRGLKKGEIGLSNSQYSNFQNLKYFRIIEQIDALRYPTFIGSSWYRGGISIFNPAGMLAGKALDVDHEARLTHEPRKTIYFHEVQKQFQDKREKYQKEKTKAVTVY